MAIIKIKQIKGTIDRPAKQKRILVALGLGKLHSKVEVEGSPQILGMVKKVGHLLEVIY